MDRRCVKSDEPDVVEKEATELRPTNDSAEEARRDGK